ncbi:MAG: SRPBCC domain-containing protein [Acidimicrobiia bacterium]
MTDQITVTCVVDVSPDRAFVLFTDHIDRWWKRSPGSAAAPEVRFENGRLMEHGEILGVVSSWDPPRRIEMDWLGPHSQGGDRVVITFDPDSGGTRISVTHRRVGMAPESATAAVLGLWWGDILSRLTA